MTQKHPLITSLWMLNAAFHLYSHISIALVTFTEELIKMSSQKCRCADRLKMRGGT